MHRIVLLGVGCGPKPPAQPEGPPPDRFPPGKEWIMTPPTAEDAFYGVNQASKVQPSLAKTVATQRARDEIARSVSVKVASIVKDFMEQSGIGDAAQALEFSQAVSKGIADVTLEGSIIKDTYFESGAGGTTYYVLVEYPIGRAREMAMDQVRQQAQKEEAQYNEWKAQQGFEGLEKELEKLNGTE